MNTVKLLMMSAFLFGCGNEHINLSKDVMYVGGHDGKIITPRIGMITASLIGYENRQEYAFTLFVKCPEVVGGDQSLGKSIIDQRKGYMRFGAYYRGYQNIIELYQYENKLVLKGATVDLTKGRVLLASMDEQGNVTIDEQFEDDTPFMQIQTDHFEALRAKHKQIDEIIGK